MSFTITLYLSLFHLTPSIALPLSFPCISCILSPCHYYFSPHSGIRSIRHLTTWIPLRLTSYLLVTAISFHSLIFTLSGTFPVNHWVYCILSVSHYLSPHSGIRYKRYLTPWIALHFIRVSILSIFTFWYTLNQALYTVYRTLPYSRIWLSIFNRR